MERWLPELPHLVLWSAIIFGLSLGLALLSRQILNDPRKKAEEDKALLKQLLEGFGLEIPPELHETEAKVIKSIKVP